MWYQIKFEFVFGQFNDNARRLQGDKVARKVFAQKGMCHTIYNHHNTKRKNGPKVNEQKKGKDSLRLPAETKV